MLNRESRLAGSLPVSLSAQNWQLIWSPDSRYILATDYGLKSGSPSAFFIDPGNQEVSSAGTSLTYLLQNWKDRQKTQDLQKFNSLPISLKEVLSTSSANIAWAPRENKILYTATASATLPTQVKKPLPGSSTQAQKRDLVPGEVYVYDLEEDRNFLISSQIAPTPTPTKSLTKSQKVFSPISPSSYNNIPAHPSGWSWFPTSSHLYRVDNGKVVIIEYDNQNPVTIYSGLLLENTAIPYPSGKQMLLLTSFSTTPSASSSAQPTLYALTLR
jgi:hypothetical protein